MLSTDTCLTNAAFAQIHAKDHYEFGDFRGGKLVLAYGLGITRSNDNVILALCIFEGDTSALIKIIGWTSSARLASGSSVLFSCFGKLKTRTRIIRHWFRLFCLYLLMREEEAAM